MALALGETLSFGVPTTDMNEPDTAVISRDFIHRGVLPLVGRDGEMSLLLDAFASLLEGVARSLWISGPAGVGKSRLLDELKDRLRDHTARSIVVHAKWYESEGVEFGPLSNALEVLKPVISTAISSRIFRDGGVVDSESGIELVQIASRRYPIVLIFDDLHYLNSSTELEKFIAGLEDIPVMVVATSRPTGSPMINSFRIALTRSVPIQEVDLGPLDGAGIADATFRLFGTTPPEGLVGQIASLSAGIPLALREVFRELIASEYVRQSDGSDSWSFTVDELDESEVNRIADRVHGFSGRLSSLPDDDRTLLYLASFLGEQFNRDLLRSVAESVEMWDEERFERLILTGLISIATPTIRFGTAAGDERVCYEFTHTLLWKAAASPGSESVPDKTRLTESLMRSLVRGQGELYSVAPLEQLEPDGLDDPLRAGLLDWLVEVGRRLAPIFSETYAAAAGSILTPYIDGRVQVDTLRLLSALTSYGERLYIVGDTDRLERVATSITEILDDLNSAPDSADERVTRIESAVVVWHSALMRGDPSAARGYLDSMLETLPEPSRQSDRELRGAAEAIRLRTQFSFDKGEFGEAFELASPYLSELDRMRPETLNALMKVLLYSMLSSGRIEEARDMVDAGLRLRHEADVFTAYELLAHAANLARNENRLADLKELALEQRQLVYRYPIYRNLATNYFHLPYVAAQEGRPAEIDRLEHDFTATPPSARSTKSQIAIARYQFLLAWNILHEPDRAERCASEIESDDVTDFIRHRIAQEQVKIAIDRRDSETAGAALRRVGKYSEMLGEYTAAGSESALRTELLRLLSEALTSDSLDDLRTFLRDIDEIQLDPDDLFRAAGLLLERGAEMTGQKREWNDLAYDCIEHAVTVLDREEKSGLGHYHLARLKELLPKTRFTRFRQGLTSARSNTEQEDGAHEVADIESDDTPILRTFGALRVEGTDDTGAKIESKTRLLVAALVVVRLGDYRWIGDLTRDRLADLLWPDMDLERAVNNLHATMSYSRRFLGGSESVVQRDGVYVLTNSVRIDALEFRELVAKGNQLHDEGIYFGAAVAYRRAVEFVDGDFLEGMYAEWIDAMRDSLRAELATALERLIAIERERENYHAIPVLAERLLGLDDLHDGAYEALIYSAAARGARREAFTYFKRYESALEDYGAGPAKKVMNLMERVKAGEEV